jgi:hypothetical protein
MHVNQLRSNGGSMAALKLLFIHNFNIPYSTSSYQQLRKRWTTKFDSPYHKIFGSQYHAFKTSKCFAKLSSHWGCNQYCGYIMPMASNKAQWGKWLSNSLINCAIAPMNQYQQVNIEKIPNNPKTKSQIKIQYI